MCQKDESLVAEALSYASASVCCNFVYFDNLHFVSGYSGASAVDAAQSGERGQTALRTRRGSPRYRNYDNPEVLWIQKIDTRFRIYFF